VTESQADLRPSHKPCSTHSAGVGTKTRDPRGTPCPHGQGVFVVGDRNPPVTETTLPYASELDLQEAVRNFRAYLDILKEWDEKERVEAWTAEIKPSGVPDRC
jgi:hypothetical protein